MTDKQEGSPAGNGGPSHAREKAAPAGRRAAPRARRPERGPYDDDRLEQTGWRLYGSLLDEVRDMADRLEKAGVPASTAALAAATLHFRMPRDVEEAAELMREWRKLTATRGRARGR